MTAAVNLLTRVKRLRKLLPAGCRKALRCRMGDAAPRPLLPDRIQLERHILPWLLTPNGGIIVSIGVAEYTARFEGLVLWRRQSRRRVAVRRSPDLPLSRMAVASTPAPPFPGLLRDADPACSSAASDGWQLDAAARGSDMVAMVVTVQR